MTKKNWHKRVKLDAAYLMDLLARIGDVCRFSRASEARAAASRRPHNPAKDDTMTNITHILDRDINEIIASNKAANAAAKAEAKRQADAWAVLPPTEKARWGGRPDAWTTADETYED